MIRIPPEFLNLTDHELLALAVYAMIFSLKIIALGGSIIIAFKTAKFLIPNFWYRRRRQK